MTDSERYDQLTAGAGDLSSGAYNALQNSETAGDWYFDQGKANYGNAQGMFDQAATAGDKWYDAGWGAYDKAGGLIDQQVDQLNLTREGNQWYDNYTRDQLGQAANMTSTGEIPAAMQEAIMGSMNRALEGSMGQLINDMAGRGVINSSVNNAAMANLGQQAANAYQDNYMNTWQAVHGGMLGNANAAISGGDVFGRTGLGIAAGYGDAANNSRQLGDSYVGAGSQRVQDLLGVGNSYTDLANSQMTAGSGRINDWLNINKGYNDSLNTNIREREYLNSAVPGYWQNALGPLSMVPGFLEQMQNDFANTGRLTTVVS
jgi:hypothetical protein